ncbi:uncharacterized protein [Rutidosis leptorrhynchoides]|uniref:uncharacterized protein n=1 Tax=Rutidosis leptorrhynchoides TaxID=125765 RepID=UPI003A992829
MQGANPNSKIDDNINKSNFNFLNEKGGTIGGRSCKGCMYYSSTLRSSSRNPVCVGFTRSLPRVPRYDVEESDIDDKVRSLADFRYGCVGYSVYSDVKSQNGDGQETEKVVPECVGFKLLMTPRVTNTSSALTHAQTKDKHAVPQPQPHLSSPGPGQSASNGFFSRFRRNANVVASGIAKNARRVGNEMKESVYDILNPYRDDQTKKD